VRLLRPATAQAVAEQSQTTQAGDGQARGLGDYRPAEARVGRGRAILENDRTAQLAQAEASGCRQSEDNGVLDQRAVAFDPGVRAHPRVPGREDSVGEAIKSVTRSREVAMAQAVERSRGTDRAILPVGVAESGSVSPPVACVRNGAIPHRRPGWEACRDRRQRFGGVESHRGEDVGWVERRVGRGVRQCDGERASAEFEIRGGRKSPAGTRERDCPAWACPHQRQQSRAERGDKKPHPVGFAHEVSPFEKISLHS